MALTRDHIDAVVAHNAVGDELAAGVFGTVPQPQARPGRHHRRDQSRATDRALLWFRRMLAATRIERNLPRLTLDKAAAMDGWHRRVSSVVCL